eukprot:CAMPEP_0113689250 /NCGR_PEP_ID=MMETSP0038_2-20120614/17041_1 /TAXON_ID=2898 /ORGANISM="Cryptomonas paramecium" /LENGTH=122 /DNA_ID=CAMNT_0000610263 /DNA_START=309 /DNA_END=677 /DNA_ORIENTATION=- /assembly_acc=CAM_ASM_000170
MTTPRRGDAYSRQSSARRRGVEVEGLSDIRREDCPPAVETRSLPSRTLSCAVRPSAACIAARRRFSGSFCAASSAFRSAWRIAYVLMGTLAPGNTIPARTAMEVTSGLYDDGPGSCFATCIL